MPETKYARSGELSIAYQDVGRGSPVVWVPGFASHVEIQREIAFLGALIERIERFSRLVIFDKRGTGLSDRTLGVGTLEDRMDDIRAVFDASRIGRAALFSISEGGPLSILFAAAYPERVSHLVIYSSYAFDPSPIEEKEAHAEWLAAGWGTGILDGIFVQHGGAETTPSMARLERYSCTPMMAAEKARADARIDVRSVLAAVNVPTLVLHNRHDPLLPVELGRAIAAGISEARFVELPGDFHGSWRPHDYDLLAGEIEAFLTGTNVADVVVDRVLTTVLFSDIVDSTRTAGELGDRRWRSLLDEHDHLVRSELTRYGGREVNTTGDGFFAAFDGPGRAIRCGVAMSACAASLGLDLRVGVHTGECEIRRNDLAGIAVHVGARLAHLAEPGQVLVSSTVRDLVAGSGIEFDDLGVQELKGVPGTCHVLAVRAAG
jgi:class 3 adenylate cyclase